MEIIRTWRSDDVGVRAKGGQFADGGGRVPAATSQSGVVSPPAQGAKGTSGGGTGDLRDPGSLPAGVKSTPGAVRAHVRKTIEESVEPKKDHYTNVVPAGQKLSIGKVHSVTGTKVSVNPVRTGLQVSVTQLKSGARPAAVQALRDAGYKIPDPHPNSMAAKDAYFAANGPIDFYVQT